MKHDDVSRIIAPRWSDLEARYRIMNLVPETALPEHVQQFRKTLNALHAELGQMAGVLEEERFPAKKLTLNEVLEQAQR